MPRAAWLLAAAAGLVIIVIAAAIALQPASAPEVGRPAPGFSLPAGDGRQVELQSLLADHRAVVLVFYRGFG